MELSIKQRLGSYNVEELTKFLSEKLEERALKDNVAHNEFMQFLANFKSSRYSWRNQMLLYVQAQERGLMPVFATFDEWKGQGTTIAKGEKGLTICRPVFNDVYYEIEKDENGQIGRYVKFVLKPEQVKEFEERVKKGEMRKESEITSFIYVDSAFSLSQTTMQEQDRIEYLQRYNNTSVSTQDHERIYEQLKHVAQALGRPVTEMDIKGESLGWVEIAENGGIAIKKDMPTDAKISTLTHEIGHKLLHIQNKTAENRPQKEIQAQLFSHLAMLKLGIDAEEQFSLSYINNWSKSAEKYPPMFDINGRELSKGETLQVHLSLVIPAVDKLLETLEVQTQADIVNAEVLEQLKTYTETGERIKQAPKNLNHEEKVEIEPLRVLNQTEKAVMVKLSGKNPEDAKRQVWLPKSQVTIENKMVIEATPTIIKDKGLTIKSQASATQKAGLQRRIKV